MVTSPITFSATAAAIVLAGGIPVFADVDPKTFLITPRTVKHVLTPRTVAILPVHLFGRMANVRGLASLGLPVVEDACQAVGCHTERQFAGTIGLAGTYSFGGRKQVTAGEGGALVTQSAEIAQTARLLMNHGENFGGPVGYNYRPNEATCRLILRGLTSLKLNAPFLRPYVVKSRGPEDRPYIDKPIYELPAFRQYMRGTLPVADDLCRRTLCVR